jgi:hypothetical protein
MSRLLLIACSQKKLSQEGLVPAIDRYDGPAFRVLRKYLRESPEDPPAVLILSAKYGLIGTEQEIPNYDVRLSRASATELRPRVLETATRLLSARRWQAIGVCAGRDYLIALEGLSGLLPDDVRVDYLEGGLGPRLARLREWLRRSPLTSQGPEAR